MRCPLTEQSTTIRAPVVAKVRFAERLSSRDFRNGFFDAAYPASGILNR